MKRITIIVEEDGSFHTEADGYSDATCLKDLKKLEEVLGHVETVKEKPEARIKIRNDQERAR